MPQLTVGRWGNNLAVRFPGEIVQAAGLVEGERVDIEVRESEIVIRHATPRFTLKELFSGKPPEEWRAAYADAFDWGPDVGREVVED